MTLKSILESIDRKYMPQVSKDDLPEAMKILKDNGIQVKLTTKLPTELSYSQKQVNKEKVKNIIKDIQRGKKMAPLIVSIDNYIVDGHHRCIAYKVIDKNKPRKVIQIQLPKEQAIIEYKKVENLIQ